MLQLPNEMDELDCVDQTGGGASPISIGIMIEKFQLIFCVVQIYEKRRV